MNLLKRPCDDLMFNAFVWLVWESLEAGVYNIHHVSQEIKHDTLRNLLNKVKNE